MKKTRIISKKYLLLLPLGLGILILVFLFKFFRVDRWNYISDKFEEQYWQEAKQKASEWSEDAVLCSFFVSSENQENPKTFVLYHFLSPQKEKKMYEASWHSNGNTTAREISLDYECKEEIAIFPPKISSRKAISLALSSFQKVSPDIKVTKLSLYLKEDHWEIRLVVDKEKLYPICKVYFDQKVECNKKIK